MIFQWVFVKPLKSVHKLESSAAVINMSSCCFNNPDYSQQGTGCCHPGSDTKYCWSKFPGIMTSRRRPRPAALTAVYLQQISELCTFRFLTFSSFNLRYNVASVTYCWLPQSSASGNLSLWVNQTFTAVPLFSFLFCDFMATFLLCRCEACAVSSVIQVKMTLVLGKISVLFHDRVFLIDKFYWNL